MRNTHSNSGIYAIRHKPTGRKYVGSSANLAARRRQHFTDLRCGRHSNTYLQRSFTKHGEQEFEWIVLETTKDTSLLLEYEQQWIDKLRTLSRKKGYNIACDTKSPMKGRKHTEKFKREMSARVTGEGHPRAVISDEKVKLVFVLHAQGYSQSEIGDKVGTDNTNVSLILHGKAWKHLKLAVGQDDLQLNNTSGCTGVYQQKKTGKWVAEIIRNKQYRRLGQFEHKEDAIRARKAAERRSLSDSK